MATSSCSISASRKRQASPNPTIPGIFSVPERRPLWCPPSIQDRRDMSILMDEQCPATLWSIHFVRRERQIGDVPVVKGDWHFAYRLGCITEKGRMVAICDGSNLLDG